MRVFQDIHEASREIRRDLSRAPIISGGSVQGREGRFLLREALGYSYELINLPSREEILQYLPGGVEEWLEGEERQRISAFLGQEFSRFPSDLSHPELWRYIEGETFSYTYAERLWGSSLLLKAVLDHDWYSRRGYLSVWDPRDLKRASLPTRVPCTLGYEILVRPLSWGGDALHMIYLQRSCDFDKYWASDVYLAARLLIAIRDEILPDCVLGHLTHIILSFHVFDKGEEVL